MYINIILLIVGVSCAVNGSSHNRPEYVQTPLGNSIDKASMKLLNEAYKSADDKNVIASPLGVMLLLSFYSGAAGPLSKQEICQFLGESDYEKTSESYSALNKKLAEEDPSYLVVANKIYLSNKYTLSETFSGIAKTYDSEVECISFGDPDAAAEEINHWADKKTKGHIKHAVQASYLDPNTAAALINVIFFQGHWHVPFEKNNTKDEDFHIDNSTTVKKPTMHLVKPLFYAEDEELEVKMIELPYKEADFRMVVVLPNQIDGLPKVLAKVAETGLLSYVSKLKRVNHKIILEIPKFEVESTLNLNNLLPKVGVSQIFHENAPGIVNNDTVTVSKAFQKAFVKVDEEGATAGAFTGFITIPKSSRSKIPSSIHFKADHPFLYLILKEDKVLFAGTYTH